MRPPPINNNNSSPIARAFYLELMASLGLLAACGPGGGAETEGASMSSASSTSTTTEGSTTDVPGTTTDPATSTSATSTTTTTSATTTEPATTTATTEPATTEPATTSATTSETTTSETTTSTTTGDSTTGEEFVCPPPPDLIQEYVCFPVPMGLADCAACDATCTENNAHVAATGDPLCTYFDFSVQCGPDPTPEQPGECCYFVTHSDGLACAGRPFVVDGSARVAPAIRRSDWLPTSGHGSFDAVRPSLAGLSPETRQILSALWAADAADEHASVASFARFALHLLAAGAPASLLDGAQRAMADEIAHAKACYALAGAYSGCPMGPGLLDMSNATSFFNELPALVTAAIHEGCVGETLAALVAQVAGEQARDPAVRVILKQVAADEGRHAQLAWRFVQWALGRSPELHTVVRAAFDAALRAPVHARPWPADADHAALRAHGRLAPEEQVALCRDALAGIIAPAADALLKQPDLAA